MKREAGGNWAPAYRAAVFGTRVAAEHDQRHAQDGPPALGSEAAEGSDDAEVACDRECGEGTRSA